MKKIMLVLAVLVLAAPAMATVTLSLVDEGSNVIRLDYTVSGEPNLVRAFALDITAVGGTIDTITDYKTGESTSGAPGYGIFPGSIAIDVDGNVTSYGDPVADGNDPDNPGQLGSASIVVELGSLYQGAANAPGNSGTLCKVTASSGTYEVCVSENSLRAGVVLEDVTQDPTVVGDCVQLCACKGDVNASTTVSIADLSTIVAFLSPAYTGTTPPYTAPQGDVAWGECADTTADNNVSIADLSDIVSYLSPAYSGTTPPYTGPCMP
jgi:hypothetical protein